MKGLHRMNMTLLTTVVCLTLPVFSALAENKAKTASTAQNCLGGTEKCVTLTGHFLTQMHLRNDTDFDPSERVDDLDGQSDGQVATFFVPTLRLNANAQTQIVYQLELGWNAWSRNDPGYPNQFVGGDSPGLMARHKQIWGQWESDTVRVRAGYQPLKDPSRLFLDHTVGAMAVRFSGSAHQLDAIAAQLPETTYEGMDVGNDNFTTDSFLFGVTYGYTIGQGVFMDGALYSLMDQRSIGRPLLLNTGVLGVRVDHDAYQAWFHVLGQHGQWQDMGLSGDDVAIQSYAIQMGARGDKGHLRWATNVFALSADDDHAGNDVEAAFFGSAKNHSSSVFLTEDEQRDRYDNLDERMGSYWGALTYNPAGLAVADFALSYALTPEYRPGIVIATGVNLNASRALGQQYVGTEISVLQDLILGPHASVFLNGLVFLPGALQPPW